MSRQLDKLARRLEAIPASVKASVQPALLKSGDELAGRMKQLVPVDQGDLKGSITVTPAGQSTPAYSQPGGSKVVPENAVAVTAGNAQVRYGHLVEYGTVDTEAQPYFWPSYRLLKKRISNRIKREIRKAVKESRT